MKVLMQELNNQGESKMKRILSIILAMSLLISLIPTALAAIDETTGLNKLVYNFNYGVFGKESRYDFTTEATGFGTVSGAATSPFSVLRWTTPNTSATSYFDGECYRFTAKSGSAGALLLEIEVDKAGTYKPSVEFMRVDRGGYLELYVMQDVAKLDKTDTASGVDSKLFGDVTSNYARLDDTRIDTATSASETYTSYEYMNTVNLKEGKNYLAIVLNTANATAENLKSGKAMLYVNKVTFNEVKAEPAPEPDEDGIISYEFNYDSIGLSESDASSIPLSHVEEDGTIQGGKNWTVLHSNLNTRAIYKTFAKFTASEGDDGQPLPEGIQLAITVPKTGTYSPSFKYQKHNRGGHLKIYIHNEPISSSEIRSLGYRSAYADLTPLDNKYTDLNTGESDWNICTFENVTLNAGTNYLTFVIDGTSVDSSVSKWNKPIAHIEYFMLTPVADAPADTVSYCITTNLPGAKLNILNAKLGEKISLSATETDGYTFRAWVRGSADNGIWVSSNEEYTFNAMTHTMLTAVYTKNSADDAEKLVEYYNENGAYIATKPVTENAPTPKKLVGYKFDDWYIGDEIKLALDTITDALTRAVAKHTAEETLYTVTCGDSSSQYKYDEKITLSSATPVCWLRNGKAVAYGKEYTFYVWGDTVVTTAAGDNLPKVMLDSAKGNSRMIEYDAGNGTIIEAGIIFGNSSAITVDSCLAKMSAQRLASHGQFTATSEYSVARGYIIYENINGGLAVLYAD